MAKDRAPRRKRGARGAGDAAELEDAPPANNAEEKDDEKDEEGGEGEEASSRGGSDEQESPRLGAGKKVKRRDKAAPPSHHALGTGNSLPDNDATTGKRKRRGTDQASKREDHDEGQEEQKGSELESDVNGVRLGEKKKRESESQDDILTDSMSHEPKRNDVVDCTTNVGGKGADSGGEGGNDQGGGGGGVSDGRGTRPTSSPSPAPKAKRVRLSKAGKGGIGSQEGHKEQALQMNTQEEGVAHKRPGRGSKLRSNRGSQEHEVSAKKEPDNQGPPKKSGREGAVAKNAAKSSVPRTPGPKVRARRAISSKTSDESDTHVEGERDEKDWSGSEGHSEVTPKLGQEQAGDTAAARAKGGRRTVRP